MPRRIRKRLLVVTGELAACCGFWLWIVGKVTWQEWILSVPAAALTVAVAETLRRKHVAGFRPDVRWLLHAWRVPLHFVTDSFALFRELVRAATRWRAPVWELREIALPHRGNDPRSAAGRALVVLYMTSTPSSVVVDLDPGRGTMLVHRLPSGDLDQWIAMVSPP